MIKKTVLLAALFASSAALATEATETSPTGGPLPAGVTRVGGVVVDLRGTNGNRVVSQLAASNLFRGFSNLNENPGGSGIAGNPLTIGQQTGFTSSVLSNLGGGLAAASFRLTLFDGDSAAGNFDFNENTFFVNGVNAGNFSTVLTTETNNTGTTQIGAPRLGFGDDILSTGFFSLADPAGLTSLFNSLVSTNQLVFTLTDVDPGDNFYDFTRGVDGGLINVGTGPTVITGAVPEPATWAMMIFGFGAVGGMMRRVRLATKLKFA